ncbi:MAG: hypothetical protein ACJAR0_004063 [Candidatus Azotimanducaceae bacterium]|jgi:hypothetical protein
MDWMDRIKELGVQPPVSNEVIIRIELPPVSLQASANAKNQFIQAVREECSKYSFLISIDVKNYKWTHTFSLSP